MLHLDTSGKGETTMMKYAVMTDSACDLPQELADQHHIDILCFKIALDGEGYTERVDFTGEEFSEMLRHAKGMPMTSQVTCFEFFDQFERYHQQGVEQVLYVCINATGSGTYAAAQSAVEQFHAAYPDSLMKITIVDSHSYSITYGLEVCKAEQMLSEGKDMQEVVDYLNDRFARMELVLTAYTLKVIRKSGRISAAAAIAGDLLGIHPIFTLVDGVSKVIKKVRGDKAVLTAFCNHVKQHMVAGTPYYIGVTNPAYRKEYIQAMTKALGYPPEMVIHLGSAVCSNTGPDCAAALYEGAKRER